MYKAIIDSVINPYEVTVQIPFLDKGNININPDLLGRDVIKSSSLNGVSYPATIVTTPGCKPNYLIDDIVYIDFEENDLSRPVVLGLLYRQNGNVSLLDANINNLQVYSSAELPEDSVIGEVNNIELSYLRYLSSNVQSQLDILEGKIDEGGSYPYANGQDF